ANSGGSPSGTQKGLHREAEAKDGVMLTRLKRRAIRVGIVLLIKLITRTEVHGLDTLRALRGKAIVVSNHLGRLDAAYAFVLINRPDTILVVAEKYKEWPIFRWLVKHLDLLWLERFGADFGTLKDVLRRLERGGILFMAPEGTRSPRAALIEGKPGATYLAAKSQAVVIPAAIFGSEDRVALKQLGEFRRPHIQIVVGDPFTIPPLPKKNRAEFLQRYTDEIMARIAILLPPNYRGVYATHPRVVELLF
ncbi:MAG: lysophospholipid acyltransferase family protein, partial [Anaerolineales bacterium]